MACCAALMVGVLFVQDTNPIVSIDRIIIRVFFTIKGVM